MSRLIDSGPDVIEFFPEVDAEDSYGTPVRIPSSTPVRLTAQVKRSSSDEADALGQQALSTWRFTTSRDLPPGPWSALTVNGRPAQVVGEPQPQGRSPRTRHTLVRFEYRDAAEVVPGGEQS